MLHKIEKAWNWISVQWMSDGSESDKSQQGDPTLWKHSFFPPNFHTSADIHQALWYPGGIRPLRCRAGCRSVQQTLHLNHLPRVSLGPHSGQRTGLCSCDLPAACEVKDAQRAQSARQGQWIIFNYSHTIPAADHADAHQLSRPLMLTELTRNDCCPTSRWSLQVTLCVRSTPRPSAHLH